MKVHALSTEKTSQSLEEDISDLPNPRESKTQTQTPIGNISIPGVSNFLTAPNLSLKFLWLFANLVCWGCFVFVFIALTQKYLSYPTLVNVDIHLGTNLDFPAVTVCNLNRVVADQIPATSKYHGLTYLNYQVSQQLNFNTKGGSGGGGGGGGGSEEGSGGGGGGGGPGNDDDDDDDDDDKDGPEQDIPDDFEELVNEQLYTDINWAQPDWFEVYNKSLTEDYRDIYPMTFMNKSEVDAYGVKISDFIFTCAYDQHKCTLKDFQVSEHERYGKCFTFNSALQDRPKLYSDNPTRSYSRKITEESNYYENTARTGALYGLKVSLWLDIGNYVSLISPAEGAILSVHNPRVEPDLEKNAIFLKPGFNTNIGVKRTTIKRMGAPYSDCVDKYPERLHIPDKKRKRFLYNQQICVNYCYQTFLFKKCGCYESFMLGSETLCDHTNVSIEACVVKTWRKIKDNSLKCNECPAACWDDFYETGVSSSIWPTDAYMPYLIDYVRNNIDEDSRLRKWLDMEIKDRVKDFHELQDIGETVRKQMTRFTVHFETMSYESIKFYESYSLVQYIADIGGYIGLFVGVCAMTLFELVDLCMQILFTIHNK